MKAAILCFGCQRPALNGINWTINKKHYIQHLENKK